MEGFSYEQSLEFPGKGFEELGISILGSELEEIAATLGGIPSWLTLYGYYRGIRRLDHREALKLVTKEGLAIALSELEKVIENSRARYTAILKAVVSGFRGWKDVKTFIETIE